MHRKCSKIIGIGWNYAKHAAELNNAVPKNPVIFLKPPSSIITQGEKIQLPKGLNVHHEIELGVVIGKSGKFITAEEASSYVHSYFLALDMTARDIQPWTVAKGYDTFTPIGVPIPSNLISNVNDLTMTLSVDGKITQKGSPRDMVFKIPQLIEYVSTIMKLEPGDIILTGTPEGVGPVRPGQTLVGTLVDETDGKVVTTMEFSAVSS